MTEAMTAAYAAGALGVALSGAGPTLLAIAQGNIATVATSLQDAFQNNGIACQTRQLLVDTTGATVLPATPMPETS
jgi:homoserine kinase